MKNKIRGLILAGMFAVGCNPGFAATLGDFYGDVVEQTHVTILKNASPAFFYDLKEGSDKSAQAGVITHMVTYRMVYLDLGWKTALDAKEKGTGVAGMSFSADKTVGMLFPNYSAWIGSFIPASAMPFWQAFFVGGVAGVNFDNGTGFYGISSGVDLKF